MNLILISMFWAINEVKISRITTSQQCFASIDFLSSKEDVGCAEILNCLFVSFLLRTEKDVLQYRQGELCWIAAQELNWQKPACNYVWCISFLPQFTQIFTSIKNRTFKINLISSLETKLTQFITISTN